MMWSSVFKSTYTFLTLVGNIMLNVFFLLWFQFFIVKNSVITVQKSTLEQDLLVLETLNFHSMLI